MIELFESDKYEANRHSSKGNQLKWSKAGVWYKTDYLGYEGLSESVVSAMLRHSSLSSNEYIIYKPEQIRYRNSIYNGVRSEDFLRGRGELITLERLFNNRYGRSLYKSVFDISDVTNRLKYMVDCTRELTGLNDFGIYMNKLLTIDAMFLNDDRHMHNIAVIMLYDGGFDYCPIFDNGGALLSDTTIDYPMEMDIYDLISRARSKTISTEFNEQLDVSEKLYGCNIFFDFNDKDIVSAVRCIEYYSAEQQERVISILREQRRKYRYLFKDSKYSE